MSWSFMTRLQEEIHNHSTFVGKISLAVFVVFRIVLTAVGGELIYKDDRSTFSCNTLQPGCNNACYDASSPFSNVCFWVFQIILVATPSLMYLGFVVNRTVQPVERVDPVVSVEVVSDGAAAKQDGSKHVKVNDGRQRIKADGLMPVYVLQLLVRSFVEVAFLCGQYFLYGLAVSGSFVCSEQPCPLPVACSVSSSTQKTIFLLITYAVSLLCLVLNIWEMLHLGIGTVCEIMRSSRVNKTRQG